MRSCHLSITTAGMRVAAIFWLSLAWPDPHLQVRVWPCVQCIEGYTHAPAGEGLAMRDYFWLADVQLFKLHCSYLIRESQQTVLPYFTVRFMRLGMGRTQHRRMDYSGL